MATELKPCPFCGIPPKIHETNAANIDWWVVYCKNKVCEVRPMTHYRRIRREAIEAWNRRTENG